LGIAERGEADMLQGFKQFMVAGNVLDLAVTVVMGAAFGALVTALVKDFITPFIAVIIGRPDITGRLYGCSHQATRPMAIRSDPGRRSRSRRSRPVISTLASAGDEPSAQKA
jgi:hypothetical protein